MPSHLRAFAKIFPALFLGCLGCFTLHVGLGWTAIASAAALGFAVTFVPLPASWDPRLQYLSFATGTFVGMSSTRILANPLQVAEMSALSTAIFVAARPHWNGIGGKLGAIAFVSTAVWLLLLALG